METEPTVKIGMVVPVIQTRFVPGLVKRLLKWRPAHEFAVCIVNDGKEQVARELAGFPFPDRVHLLNLPQNRCFAGANNAGWDYLTRLYPTLRYLGSMNDDTIPGKRLLEKLTAGLERFPRAAVAMPVMQIGNRLFPRSYAVWQLGNVEEPMRPLRHRIDSDSFASAINGFCFLARREALQEVGFFDERYRNSCEDVDLALKLLSRNWRIVACRATKVYHHEAQSRYLAGHGTDLDASHRLLLNKWGFDLTRFNRLDRNGFLIHDPD